MRFRNKPREITAYFYVGIEEHRDVHKLNAAMLLKLGAPIEPTEHWGGACQEEQCVDNYSVYVDTPTGQSLLRPGDYLVYQQVNGVDDWYPMSAESLHQNWVPVE